MTRATPWCLATALLMAGIATGFGQETERRRDAPSPADRTAPPMGASAAPDEEAPRERLGITIKVTEERDLTPEEWRGVESALSRRGYIEIADGNVGAGDLVALAKFQKDMGLEVTPFGRIDRATIDRLEREDARPAKAQADAERLPSATERRAAEPVRAGARGPEGRVGATERDESAPETGGVTVIKSSTAPSPEILIERQERLDAEAYRDEVRRARQLRGPAGFPPAGSPDAAVTPPVGPPDAFVTPPAVGPIAPWVRPAPQEEMFLGRWIWPPLTARERERLLSETRAQRREYLLQQLRRLESER